MPDLEKIKAILEWEPSMSIKGVWSFLGFANFYYMFIENYFVKAAPFMALIGKGVAFVWEEQY